MAATLAAEGGDAEGALDLLEQLEAEGWPFLVPESDFGKVAALPRFRALAARLAARTLRGGPAQVAFTVGPADLIPEGIACDDASGAAFVGSIGHRKIVRIDGAAARDLVPTGQGGIVGVLGMTVDRPRRWLWAAHNPVGKAARASGRSGLAAFDLETGATRAAAWLDGEHLLNDVAVAPTGDVYVTDSERGTVWRLRGGAGALERVAPEGTFYYPNGIVWLEERAAPIVADASGLHLLDPATSHPRRVARGPAKCLGGVDGLQRAGDSLVAVQNGYRGERVVRWRFDPAALAVTGETVLQSMHPSFAAPTTGCVRGGRYLFIANSHISDLGAEGRPKDPARLRPLEVLELPLD